MKSVLRKLFQIYILSSSFLFADDADIDKYLHFLKDNPENVGKLGNYKKGEIEIVADAKRIKEISALQKARFQKMGLSSQEAEEASYIGIIGEDIYWLFVRDAVIFPTGAEGSFNRVIRKSSLEDGIGGVAILPLLPDGKIALNINFRHATRSWELEMPRGARQAYETPLIAAKRELEEETGMQMNKHHFLGNLAPHTGTSGAVSAVFLGYIEKRGVSNQDYSEAIFSIEAFTLAEIKEAFKVGYIERKIKGKKEKIWVRDSFLTYALFQAENEGLLFIKEN